MDKNKAIELLKQAIKETGHLRTLSYDNEDFELWVSKQEDIIKASLDKDDYETFSSAYPHYFLYGDASQSDHQERHQKETTMRETALKKIIQKYEVLGVELEPAVKTIPKDTAKSPLQLFDALQLHPKVVETSRGLFRDGHYRDAIYRAFVEVNNVVKERTSSQLDGKRLMSTVFSLDNPIIKLNSLETQSDRDEQEGFMFLFMGAIQGIRNPKAHENIIQNDPYRTIEYLGLASLLLKIAQEGTLCTNPPKF